VNNEKWKERVMAVLTTTPDPKYINNQQMHSNIHDLFYSHCPQQHDLAGIPAIFRVILLQEY
jgi:hypothetical protein